MSTDSFDHIDQHGREIYQLPAFPGVWARGDFLLCLVEGRPKSLRAQLIEAEAFTGRPMVSGLRIPIDYLPRDGWWLEQPLAEFMMEILRESIAHAQQEFEISSWVGDLDDYDDLRRR